MADTQTNDTIQGRRVPWPTDRIPVEQEKFMAAGDYSGPWRGLWLICTPTGDWGSLTPSSGHAVTENANGTITVAPSIQCETGGRWHGYLKNGEWSLA